MTKMFVGEPIPGLLSAIYRHLPPARARYQIIIPSDWKKGLAQVQGQAIEFDDLIVRLRADGFNQPELAAHVEWLMVGDPRVVRNGRLIRSYTGPVDGP